jgi:hypothetical protein
MTAEERFRIIAEQVKEADERLAEAMRQTPEVLAAIAFRSDVPVPKMSWEGKKRKKRKKTAAEILKVCAKEIDA